MEGVVTDMKEISDEYLAAQSMTDEEFEKALKEEMKICDSLKDWPCVK